MKALPYQRLAYTSSGITNGARYERSPSRRSLAASSSPMTVCVSGLKSIVLPNRYEAFARCTKAHEICPSSIGACRSAFLRLTTQSMKF